VNDRELPHTATYLYAVGRPAPPPETFEDVRGVHPGPLRIVSEGGLAAVVQTVPRDAFDSAALERRLNDMAELDRLVRGHHRVVQAAGSVAATVPMRIMTVCEDDAAVRRTLRDHADRLSGALDRVAGRAEWGVKAYGRTTPQRAAPTAPGTGPTAGRDYLRRRRAERREADRSHAELLRAVGELDRELRAVADDVRHLPPRRGSSPAGMDLGADTEPGETNVFNAAYLVARDRTAEFGAVLERWEGSPLRLDVGGPWVPYSFTEPEEGSDAGGAFP
jgi:hypothetical protein